jgi:prevent-host-death family protein
MITESIKQQMETFTIEEFQLNFDNLLDRVEKGESFSIKSENGDVIIMPYSEYHEASESI